MKQAFYSLLLLSILSLSSCRLGGDDEGPDFVEGEILVRLRETTTLNQAFALFNGIEDLEPLSATSFAYINDGPTSGHPEILDALDIRDYLSYSIDTSSDVLFLVISLRTLTLENQNDFLELLEDFDLQRTNENELRFLRIGTPVGQEEAWVQELDGHPLIEYAQLNQIVTF